MINNKSHYIACFSTQHNGFIFQQRISQISDETYFFTLSAISGTLTVFGERVS